MHFYKGLSPTDYWNLTTREFNALCEYMDDYAAEVERANRG